MKTFLQLSPHAQDVVLHLKYQKARAGDELPVSSVLLASSKRGVRIKDTLSAVDECVTAGWMVKRLGSPDRICLTPDGFGMLLFMP